MIRAGLLCLASFGCVGAPTPAPAPAEDPLACFAERRDVANSLLVNAARGDGRTGLVDLRVTRVGSWPSHVVCRAEQACEALGIAAGETVQLECNAELAESEGTGPLGSENWRVGDVKRCVVRRHDLVPDLYYRFWVILAADPSGIAEPGRATR